MYDDYTEDVDVVLRYETLEKDLKTAFAQAGIPWKGSIARVNRTDERHSRVTNHFIPPGMAARFILADAKNGYKFE